MMIYSLVFAAVVLGLGIGASLLMATPPIMVRDLNFGRGIYTEFCPVVANEFSSTGACTNPRVSFSSGTFVPKNLVDFPMRYSVSEPGKTFPFIYSQLVNKYGLQKTDPVVLACLKAAPPAEALGAKGIAADTFNAGLRFTTDFAAVDKSGPSTGSSARSPARSPSEEPGHVSPPPKAALPPVPPPSPVRPPLVLRKEGSRVYKPVPSPPHAPVPPHHHHPASGLHSWALRDVDVGTKGPTPDKHEGLKGEGAGPKPQNGVKGGAPPAKGQNARPPSPPSSLPPPQSLAPAHSPSPVPTPGLV
ncbi:hypothetical protein BS47DRAFT_1385868 [Hydnum rufescens UP504]|uniref:Uncharacterized protein n=1 Tax=Hydnum rufescens UP504 TaxID=1448309 RepID=A0A9P6AH38_9AGAM|nr:hypothetical protein BS47DRAFT_1385868 [Hydnum rufescens UP504]